MTPDITRWGDELTAAYAAMGRAAAELSRSLAATSAALEATLQQLGWSVRARMAAQWGDRPVIWALRCIARYEHVAVWHPRVIGLWIRTQYDLLDGA